MTYTDEFTGHVRVEVSDGRTDANATASVTIANVPPTIEGLSASAVASADFRLVTAGTKGGAVTFTLQNGGLTLAEVRVVREPGNPAEEARSSGPVAINVTQPLVAWALFTPPGNPSNGGPNGDDPAWLVVSFPNGTSITLFHNFNAQHRETWNWSLAALPAMFARTAVALEAHLTDPGADALTARWDFGDGTTVTQVFPNGPAGDAPEAPVGGTPMDVLAGTLHTYAAAGSYTVVLAVTDADGATTTQSLTVQVGT